MDAAGSGGQLNVRHDQGTGPTTGNAMPDSRFHAGTLQTRLRSSHSYSTAVEDKMGKGALLWLIGIPLPIILLIWLFGGLS